MAATGELAAMEKAFRALEGLDGDGRKRAVTWLASVLDVEIASSTRASTSVDSAGDDSLEGVSAKQFLAAKKPRTTTERVTCLGFFMAFARDKPHFKTSDLAQLNVEAAGPPFSNISQAAKDAVKAYYLVSAGKQNRQITPFGEALVRALPDRERVKQVLRDERPIAPRRRSRSPRGQTQASSA